MCNQSTYYTHDQTATSYVLETPLIHLQGYNKSSISLKSLKHTNKESQEENMEEGKGRKIIMFPLPFQGHFHPMIQLARLFHHRGFSVTILHTSFNSPDPSDHPLFTFRTVPHNNVRGKDPLTQREASGMDLVAFIRLLRQTYAEPFRQALAAEVGEGETVCCLVSDAIWARNSEVAAEEVGVPRIVLITNGVASFCAFAAFPLLRDKHYLPIQGKDKICFQLHFKNIFFFFVDNSFIL